MNLIKTTITLLFIAPALFRASYAKPALSAPSPITHRTFALSLLISLAILCFNNASLCFLIMLIKKSTEGAARSVKSIALWKDMGQKFKKSVEKSFSFQWFVSNIFYGKNQIIIDFMEELWSFNKFELAWLEIRSIKFRQFKRHTALAGLNSQNQDNNFKALRFKIQIFWVFLIFQQSSSCHFSRFKSNSQIMVLNSCKSKLVV